MPWFRVKFEIEWESSDEDAKLIELGVQTGEISMEDLLAIAGRATAEIVYGTRVETNTGKPTH